MFARIPGGDPDPVRGTKRHMKKDTYREAHTETDTLDPLTRHGRLRALSGYIGAKELPRVSGETKLRVLRAISPDTGFRIPFSTFR